MGSIYLGGAVTLTSAIVPLATYSTMTAQRGLGASAQAQELTIQGNDSEANVLALQSLHTHGYSAMTFRTSGGYEVGSIGYCNALASVAAAKLLLEVTDASVAFGGQAPDFYIGQFTNYNGSGTGQAHYTRIAMLKTGEMDFLTGSTQVRMLRIDPTLAKAYFGPSSTITVDTTSNGASIVMGGFSNVGTITANGSLVLQGSDANTQIVVRDTTGRPITFNAFGGTLAQGGGHIFKTGGVLGSQVTRMTIADDITQITTKLRLSGLPTSSTGLSSGDVYSNSGVLTIVP